MHRRGFTRVEYDRVDDTVPDRLDSSISFYAKPQGQAHIYHDEDTRKKSPTLHTQAGRICEST